MAIYRFILNYHKRGGAQAKHPSFLVIFIIKVIDRIHYLANRMRSVRNRAGIWKPSLYNNCTGNLMHNTLFGNALVSIGFMFG